VEQPQHFRYYCFADKNQEREGCCSMSYIISYASNLEKQRDLEIEVEVPTEDTDYF